MTREQFQANLKKAYPWVNEETFAQFERYKNFLQQYNSHTNLTNLADEEKIYGEYF